VVDPAFVGWPDDDHQRRRPDPPDPPDGQLRGHPRDGRGPGAQAVVRAPCAVPRTARAP